MKICITGLGIVSSLGNQIETFWSNLRDGRSGISDITSFDTTLFSSKKSGEIRNFSCDDLLTECEIENTGKLTQYFFYAIYNAICNAGLDLKSLKNKNVALCIGSTMGEAVELENIDRKIYLKEPVEPVLYKRYSTTNIKKFLVDKFQISGISIFITNACATGNYTIGIGTDLIKRGLADIVIAGSGEVFSKVTFYGFNRLLSLAPEKCMPFDKNRKGLIIGEGAGIVILEEKKSAIKRGAHIWANIEGYAIYSDAFHITRPDPIGFAASLCISQVCKLSQTQFQNIDYISAHGTGTPANDTSEVNAYVSIFGDKNKIPPVSSIKAMLGHTLAAASSIEAIACCLMMRKQVALPTINYETPDPQCAIDCIPNKAREMKIETVLSNSFAFGGNCSSLLLTKNF